jgi:hypothetical protein
MGAKRLMLLTFSCAVLLLSSACSADNNLLLGQVEATVDAHPVIVTDCYRTSVPPPYNSGNTYHFTPCRDADVWIDNEALSVNGRIYGALRPGDTILVDHGVVSVKHPKQ